MNSLKILLIATIIITYIFDIIIRYKLKSKNIMLPSTYDKVRIAKYSKSIFELIKMNEIGISIKALIIFNFCIYLITALLVLILIIALVILILK